MIDYSKLLFWIALSLTALIFLRAFISPIIGDMSGQSLPAVMLGLFMLTSSMAGFAIGFYLLWIWKEWRMWQSYMVIILVVGIFGTVVLGIPLAEISYGLVTLGSFCWLIYKAHEDADLDISPIVQPLLQDVGEVSI